MFKVETIGDCYVACCGLPEPRPDHAVVMGRFAYECLKRMKMGLGKRESVLGPDHPHGPHLVGLDDCGCARLAACCSRFAAC